MSRKAFGLIFVLLALLLGRCSTMWFGNHWMAESWPEALCDSFVLMLAAYGVSCTSKGEMTQHMRDSESNEK